MKGVGLLRSDIALNTNWSGYFSPFLFGDNNSQLEGAGTDGEHTTLSTSLTRPVGFLVL